MGFKQTATHRTARARYHQIGLVRGQFGNVPDGQVGQVHRRRRLRRLGRGSWELDLRKCDTDAGAAAYAKERVDLAKKHGLEIFTVATHLQGQVLGDEPSAKTLQLLLGKGEARAAYKAWRDSGQQPAADRPVFRARRGRQAGPRSRRSKDLLACVRLRRAPRQAAGPQGRAARASSARRPTAGATGSCSRRCPARSDGYKIPDVRQVSLELLVERFGPVWDACKKYGVTFDLECHPSERAMGDIESASDYINHMCKAGYEGVVGFNLDGSHMEWQNVSVVAVHPRVRRVHPLRPRQGRVGGARALPGRPARRPPADGPLGQRLELRHRRHRPRRQLARRDLHRAEPRRLRRRGVSIEWEDNDAEQHAGAKAALANCRKADLPPSGMRHDEMLKG